MKKYRVEGLIQKRKKLREKILNEMVKEHEHDFKHIIYEGRSMNKDCKKIHKWVIHRCGCGLETVGLKIGV